MAWIPSHTDTGRHPKTRKFARELGVSIPAAIGHLHLFWYWVMDFNSNGDITNADVTDVTDAALWSNEPQKFMDALLISGFVDNIENRLLIHDWDEYGGKLLEKKNLNAERQAKYRERHNASNSKGKSQKQASDNEPHREGKPANNNSNGNVTVMSHESNATEKRREEKSTEEKSTPKGVGTENAPPKKNHEFLHPEKIPNIDSPLAIEIRKICKKPIYLSENDREKMREALVILESQNATVEQMKDFGAKVQFHWCGRDRQTKQRCPPGIMQVAENWQAVLAIDTTRTTKSKKHTEAELDAMAAKYA